MADQATTDAENSARAAVVKAALAQFQAIDAQAVADIQAATAEAKADMDAAVAQMKQVNDDMLAASQRKPIPSLLPKPPQPTIEAPAQEKPGQPVAPAGPT